MPNNWATSLVLQGGSASRRKGHIAKEKRRRMKATKKGPNSRGAAPFARVSGKAKHGASAISAIRDSPSKRKPRLGPRASFWLRLGFVLASPQARVFVSRAQPLVCELASKSCALSWRSVRLRLLRLRRSVPLHHLIGISATTSCLDFVQRSDVSSRCASRDPSSRLT